MAEQKWPDTIWLVRHGQSSGNVARDEAESASLPLIDLATRDMDTPLSALGTEQAIALGRWFGNLDARRKPTVALCSPYVRAEATTRLILQYAATGPDRIACQPDERLREKEFGILDRLTKLGIEQKYPELAEQRRHVGKFYFRPPGGESWCDVLLRLRGLIDTIVREHRREKVLIVSHQVIVNCFRYLFERLDEHEILEIDRDADVPNCSVTSYEFDASRGKNGKLVPGLVNFVAPLEQQGAAVTAAPDAPAAPKP